MIFRDVTGTVGRTPLVELERLAVGLPGQVVVVLLADTGERCMTTELFAK